MEVVDLEVIESLYEINIRNVESTIILVVGIWNLSSVGISPEA